MWWFLQFSHGGEAVENQRSSVFRVMVLPGFNSATAVKPWRTAPIGDGRSVLTMLQFGHGGEDVETAEYGADYWHELELQFGHGGEAVENMVHRERFDQ